MLAHVAPAAREVLFDLVERERVVTGRHRCVGGEHRRAAHRGHGLVERGAALDVFADALQRDERRVAFVQVPHRGRDAQRAQRAHAADAEDHLLLDAHLAIAAVEARRELAIPRRVLREIGVEQEQAHAPEPNPPDRGQHRAIAERHRGHAGAAFGREGGLDWRLHPRQPLVAFLLPAVVRHPLVEVALRIHEADADERHAEIAGLLAMVAGQHAQAAGVDRQGLVQRELRREVRNRAAVEGVAVLAPPRVHELPLCVAPGDRLVVGLQETRVIRRLPQALRGELLQHLHRVVRAVPPQPVIEPAEHVARADVPAPPQVDRQLVQAVNAAGERGGGGESFFGHGHEYR